ncbi:hypothetical protein chiPu_0031409, partial [Chiloscyllium punctatum]|nr:hypothetical protein [Chiloscyllium punctatum]
EPAELVLRPERPDSVVGNEAGRVGEEVRDGHLLHLQAGGALEVAAAQAAQESVDGTRERCQAGIDPAQQARRKTSEQCAQRTEGAHPLQVLHRNGLSADGHQGSGAGRRCTVTERKTRLFRSQAKIELGRPGGVPVRHEDAEQPPRDHIAAGHEAHRDGEQRARDQAVLLLIDLGARSLAVGRRPEGQRVQIALEIGTCRLVGAPEDLEEEAGDRRNV